MTSESERYRIAVDLMGSDTAPFLLLDGLINQCQDLYDKLFGQLFGLHTQKKLKIELHFILSQETRSEIGVYHHKQKDFETPLPFFFHFADSFIGMNEEPLQALREKRNSSLQLGLEGLASGRWDALISCGNTAFLIAAVTLWLPFFSNYKGRPALIAELPTPCHPTLLLDVGANASSDQELLLWHAKLGKAWWLSQKKRERRPRLGLLNMGKEAFKGGKLRRAVHSELAKNQEIEFIGNIEADFLSRQEADQQVDIVLSDGFSGNVFLKATEGAFFCLLHQLQNSRFNSVELMQTESLQQLLYRGAVVAGPRQLVMKCHGRGSSLDLFYTLLQAVELLQSDVLKKIEKEL